jgi:hypothetical protein
VRSFFVLLFDFYDFGHAFEQLGDGRAAIVLNLKIGVNLLETVDQRG